MIPLFFAAVAALSVAIAAFYECIRPVEGLRINLPLELPDGHIGVLKCPDMSYVEIEDLRRAWMKAHQGPGVKTIILSNGFDFEIVKPRSR